MRCNFVRIPEIGCTLRVADVVLPWAFSMQKSEFCRDSPRGNENFRNNVTENVAYYGNNSEYQMKSNDLTAVSLLENRHFNRVGNSYMII